MRSSITTTSTSVPSTPAKVTPSAKKTPQSNPRYKARSTNRISIQSAAMKKRKAAELTSPTVSARKSRGKRLIWRDIYAEVRPEISWLSSNSAREQEKQVVMGQVSGLAEAGQVTVIMGDSGAGKTVLLNILAQRAHNLKIYGDLEVNGHVVEPGEMETMSSFVEKEDVFLGHHLTFYETLAMAARLRMPMKSTAEERKERVDNIAAEMELQHILDEKVCKMNISRGQRKRLSIACEALVERPILFFDEPIYGLGDMEALLTMKIFRELVREGKTIICTITQATSHVFHLTDWVILLTNGQVAFQGPTARTEQFFASCGLPCPEYHSIPDHILKTVAHPEETELARQAAETVVAAYSASEFCRHVKHVCHKYDSHNTRKRVKVVVRREYAASWDIQFLCLLKRELKSSFRNPANLRHRTLMCIVLALVQGFVFFRTSLRAETVLTGRGVAFEAVRSMNVLFMVPSVQILLSELPVVYHDYQAGMYCPSAYILGKGVAEGIQHFTLPFLTTTIFYWLTGLSYDFYQYFRLVIVSILETCIASSIGYASACIFGDLSRSTLAVVAFSLPMMLLSGFFIDYSSIPPFLLPISYLSWFRYGYTINLAIIFDGVPSIRGCPRNETKSNPCPFESGSKLIESWGAGAQSVISVTALLLMLVAWRIVAVVTLSLRLRSLTKKEHHHRYPK